MPGSSFLKMAVAEDSALYGWANIFGDKIVALGLGVTYTMLLGAFHKGFPSEEQQGRQRQ